MNKGIIVKMLSHEALLAVGHLGVSRCGCFFCCDDWGRANRIVIGSVETGKTAVVCYPKNRKTHAHVYLTPNSNAASVPPKLIESLSE